MNNSELTSIDQSELYRRVSAEYEAIDEAAFYGPISKERKSRNSAPVVGPRCFHVFSTIMSYMKGREKTRIANFSGINYVNPDLVLVKLLAEATDKDRFEWTTYDHCLSVSFTHPYFSARMSESGISLIDIDYRNQSVTEQVSEKYDIVISTGIIEHLDYVSLFNYLLMMRAALLPGGVAIISTPNPLYLINRVRFLLGSWDHQYFQDEIENWKKGHFGHINYYDLARLSRLLRSVGFEIKDGFTFNANHGPGEWKLSMRIIASTARLLTRFLPNAGQHVYITATVAARH